MVLRSLIAIWLIWGMNWVVMKTANTYFPPITFVTYRFTLGALIMIAIAFYHRHNAPKASLLPWIIITGVFQYAVTNITVQVGMQTLSAGMASVLNYTAPLWMTLMAKFFLEEQLTHRKMIGIFTSLVGLVVLTGVEPSENFGAIFLVVIGAIAFAAAGIIFKLKLSRENISEIVAWQMGAGALSLIICNGVTDQGPVNWTFTAVLCLIYNGVLASALAFYLWNWLLRKLSASVASTATLVVPIVGTIGGVIFLGESLTIVMVIGMIMILFGIFMVARKS